MPIPPDQQAEGRARRICKQLDRERRRRLRQQAAFIDSAVVTAGSLPPLGRATTINRVEAVLDQPMWSGEPASALSPSVPPKGRGRRLWERATERTVGGAYLPPEPPASSTTSDQSVQSVASVQPVESVVSVSSALPVPPKETKRVRFCLLYTSPSPRD